VIDEISVSCSTANPENTGCPGLTLAGIPTPPRCNCSR
jgi:hypothetical protein